MSRGSGFLWNYKMGFIIVFPTLCWTTHFPCSVSPFFSHSTSSFAEQEQPTLRVLTVSGMLFITSADVQPHSHGPGLHSSSASQNGPRLRSFEPSCSDPNASILLSPTPSTGEETTRCTHNLGVCVGSSEVTRLKDKCDLKLYTLSCRFQGSIEGFKTWGNDKSELGMKSV